MSILWSLSPTEFMDHLELPSNPQDVSYTIPLLCKGHTSNSTLDTFAEYPKRHVSLILMLMNEHRYMMAENSKLPFIGQTKPLYATRSQLISLSSGLVCSK